MSVRLPKITKEKAFKFIAFLEIPFINAEKVSEFLIEVYCTPVKKTDGSDRTDSSGEPVERKRSETAENGPSGDVGDFDDTTLGQIPKSASLPVKCVFAFDLPDEEVSNAELVSRMVSRFGANPSSVLPWDYVEGYDKYSKHGFLKRVSRWTYALSEKGRKLWEAGLGNMK